MVDWSPESIGRHYLYPASEGAYSVAALSFWVRTCLPMRPNPTTIAAHEAATGGPLPPIAAGNLPAPISSFVGRTGEVASAAEALAGSRLVTLTGAGGVGKTRLALQVAAVEAERFPDGAWFVDLARVSDPDLLASSVAASLGLRDEPGDLTRALVAYLRPRRLLLVFDNCEHVLKTCAELVNSLLVACPSVSALATSREALRIAGEAVIGIDPLPTPDPAADDHIVIGRCASVRLFVERATSTRGGLRTDAATVRTIGQICQRLEGIPLAIELAAARVTALSPDEILCKLGDRYGFLTRGDRSALRRHHTLESALDWSYDLLSPAERDLLCRLSIFAGAFSAESVTDVCHPKPAAAEDALVLLEALVAKSLLVYEMCPSGTRFRLLETVRDYAGRKLDPTEEAGLRGRHADRYLDLAAMAEPGLEGPDASSWLERLDAEHENFSAILSTSLVHGRPEVALQLAGSLAMFWRLRGHWSIGRQWLEKAIGETEILDPAVRAKALWAVGFIAGIMTDSETAIPAAERALELYQETGDEAGASRALAVLGQAWIVQHPGRALELAEEGTRLARRSGDQWSLAEALALAGQSSLMTGRLSESSRLYGESLDVAHAAGNEHGVIRALLGLGGIGSESSRASLEEALRLARGFGDPYDVVEALILLGKLSLVEGRLAVARQCLEECLTLAEYVGSPRLLARALTGLGRLAVAEGHPDRAAMLFDEGASIAQELSLNFILVRCLAGSGEAAAVRGNRNAAQNAWQEALHIAKATSDLVGTANMLLNLAGLARAERNDALAGALLHECLHSAQSGGLDAVVAAALAVRGGLAVDHGRMATAARLLGAASSHGKPLLNALDPRYSSDVAAARDALDPKIFDKAWSEGVGMGLEEAVAYAVRGRGAREERATKGWASLTNAERQVADLAPERLTSAEMAERLFISPRTVGHHLSRIYGKLGISSRRELASESLKRRRDEADMAT